MTVLEQSDVEDAAKSAEDIRTFRMYLRGLLDGGFRRDVLKVCLKQASEHLREQGEEEAADLILDGLDLLTGWTGPGMDIPEPHTV